MSQSTDQSTIPCPEPAAAIELAPLSVELLSLYAAVISGGAARSPRVPGEVGR